MQSHLNTLGEQGVLWGGWLWKVPVAGGWGLFLTQIRFGDVGRGWDTLSSCPCCWTPSWNHQTAQST